jgi:hypothetical protein
MAFSEKPPPLIDRLRSILDSYPFSIGLFRELLQNSDDAGATEQVLCHSRYTPTKMIILTFQNPDF